MNKFIELAEKLWPTPKVGVKFKTSDQGDTWEIIEISDNLVSLKYHDRNGPYFHRLDKLQRIFEKGVIIL